MLGVLTDTTLPLPILLDTIAHSETGHLTGNARATATSKRGARGMYQFMPGNLHDMGYGMPRNIPLADVLDPTKARQLAGQYVTGYTANKQFTTPLQQLVAYNAGPDFAEQWIASGANVEDLPEETKSYIRRAAEYLQNLRNNDMAMMSMDVDTDPNITIDGQVISPLMQKLAEAQQAASMARTRQARMRAEGSNYEHQTLSSTQPMNFTDGIIRHRHSRLPRWMTELDADMGMTMAMPAPAPSVYPYQRGITPPAAAPAASGGIIGKAQAATNTPAASSQQFTKMLSQLGQMQRSNVSGNRRDQSAMSYQPQVGFNDMLIRMGAAGLRGSAQGGLEALAGIGEAYSDAQDLNAKGLAAYNKAMAKGKGSGTGGFGAIVVNDAISRALPLIGNGWSTGFASYLSAIPGTEAQALKNNLATIKANIGFDKLQAMRDASPTGGALGQVSERELGFLQSVFGSLDQSQSAEELGYNIQLLQYVYNSIIHGEGNHQYSMPVYGGGPTGGSNSSQSLDAADAIVGIN